MYLSAIQPRADGVARRSHVLMTATLMTPNGAVSVRIRDISVTGAQVWAEQPVAANCDAVLKRGAFFAVARIVRSSERSLGLQFYRQLSAEEFASAFNRDTRAASAVA